MVPFDMPMDAKLALARMSVIYERENGQRVRMSRDEDIVSLINFAVDSINEEVIRQLHAFIGLLSHGEIRALVAQGANIYRGAQVPEVMDSDMPASPSVGTAMYRGQAVSGHMGSTEPEDKAAAPSRPKRIYRGRVIED